jgi:Mrp family chromosome partitioning ATPase
MDANEASNAWIQITAYQAKIKALNEQMEKIRADAARLEQAEGRIQELKRKRDLQESTYRYFSSNLDAARINEISGSGKVANISQIETPTSAFRQPINLKNVGLCAASGILVGLAWAFLIELYLDRSVRRPIDLARTLRAPLFLSIPQLKADKALLTLTAGKDVARTAPASSEVGSSSSALPSAPGSRNLALQPFHETLRDRLIGYFESKNLTHKPKLVAVTGLSHSSGVTTTAAGLARSLSETGEGNVLLVDMTVGQGAATQFNRGKEACDLDELLEARSQAHVEQNLYVVTENSNSDRLSRNLPQRFSRLIPKLKASDFDYIIFDMPVVNQLSITPRLAGFMDMVLLVVESEKSDRDLVTGACSLLAESKAHVGVVLNKTRNYVPGRLNQELMAI